MTAPVLSPTERAARAAVICHLRSAGYVGRGFDGITRAAFDEHAELAFLRAEDECRGELVNPDGRRADVDPRSLFRGTRVRAERWASEELLRHWEVAGRLSYDEYVTDLIASGLEEIGANDTTGDTVTATLSLPTREERPRGAQALDEARAFYRRFYHFPTTVQLDAFTIWTAGLSHMRDHNQQFVGQYAIRMYIRAATAQCGKSLLGDFIGLTGGRGQVLFAPTTTYWGLMNALSEDQSTVVLDNWDEVRSNKNQMLGILIGGAYEHTSVAKNGKANEDPRSFFGPVAITAIGGRLRNDRSFGPVEQRAMIVDVDKRPKGVTLERFDRRDKEIMSRAEGIRKACEDWGREVAPEYLTLRPADLPDIDDRDRDMWEPLAAIADLADGRKPGGPIGVWGKRIRRVIRVLVLGESVPDDDDDESGAVLRLTPAQRTMVECSHVLCRIDGDSITTVELLDSMAQLPGGDRWHVPQGNDRDRLLRARTMALSTDLGMFGVERSSIKVPIGNGEYRNGWWVNDVLPHRDSRGVLPAFTPAELDRAARQREEEETPFE